MASPYQVQEEGKEFYKDNEWPDNLENILDFATPDTYPHQQLFHSQVCFRQPQYQRWPQENSKSEVTVSDDDDVAFNDRLSRSIVVENCD